MRPSRAARARACSPRCRTIADLGPGEFTGDEAQVTGGPAVAGAVARGDAEVYELSNDALRQILKPHPDLGDAFMRAFLAGKDDVGSRSSRVDCRRWDSNPHR